MIDGFKISKLITSDNARMILNNDIIDFYQKTCISTGELEKSGSIEAKHNGLTIRLSPDQKGVGYWLVIRGSIHRFYNDGGTNGNDFYLWQFKEALNNLETLIKTPINDFKIENFEFGVNIETKLTASKYIRSLIYDGNKAFADLDINDNYVGKQCTRQDTTLKIYDKGKQEQNGNNRLLRIELKFNRMRLLIDPTGRFQVSTIADLLNPEKLGVLGQELAIRWNQIIFYDSGIDETKLTPAECSRLWKYRSFQFWDSLNRSNRHKARVKFDKLVNEKSTLQTQKDIEKMILEKWSKLVNIQHEKRRRLTPVFNKSEAQEKATFDTLQYMCLLSPGIIQKEKEKFQKKIEVERRFCSVCGNDISHKKKTSVTCSRKCRNIKSNQARKEKNLKKREKERIDILKVSEQMKSNPIKISIQKVNVKRVQTIFTNQIKPMKYKERRKVNRVRGSCAGVHFEFTSMRAKEFIKYCLTIK
jgi:predicted nucleic acid-binding Zn ribbon protein